MRPGVRRCTIVRSRATAIGRDQRRPQRGAPSTLDARQPPPSGPPRAPAPAPTLSRHPPAATRHPMRWTVRSRPFHLALASGALSLAIILAELGPRAFAVGVLFAVLPVPVYLALALWLDRFEPEPPQVLATTFLWGATVAAALALVVNSAVDALARDAAGDLGGLLT